LNGEGSNTRKSVIVETNKDKRKSNNNWEKIWDEDHQAYYFYNSATDKSYWEGEEVTDDTA